MQQGGNSRGVPRERQGRPVPRQGLRVHAARATSCACRAARPASTSRTPCTPTSATAASPPRSTGGSCRCARRCATARRSRSSRRAARRRTRPGSNFVVTAKARTAHPPVPQEPEAQRGGRARQAPAEPGARGVLARRCASCPDERDRIGASRSSGCEAPDELYEKIGLGERARAARRAPSAAGADARGAAAGDAAGAARDRRHRRPGRELRALLLPDPERPDARATCRAGRGVVIHREALRQPRVVPQAAREVDLGRPGRRELDRLFHVEIRSR